MPNQKFIPREVSPAMASRIARITTDAAQRGDIKSGWLLIEVFPDGSMTANASIQYSDSWRGKESTFSYGEWVDGE